MVSQMTAPILTVGVASVEARFVPMIVRTDPDPADVAVLGEAS